MPQTNFNDGHVRYEPMNAEGTINLVQNIPKVETVGVNAQTQPMQYAEVGTNTNLANNRFVQTQPMQFSEAGVNTNLPSNRYAQTQPMQYSEAGINTNLPSNSFTQTHEGKVDMKSVNIPNQNQISTHIDRCKCEDDVEMDQTGIQYRSDFARRLQKSEVIPNAQPVTNYNSERPRQTGSSTIYHIPQE